MIIFLNVLVTPWGLAADQDWGQVFLAIPLVFSKVLVFVVILAVIESLLAKLRLFRISEFISAAFVISVIAMITSVFAW